jgi:hypothetical protein
MVDFIRDQIPSLQRIAIVIRQTWKFCIVVDFGDDLLSLSSKTGCVTLVEIWNYEVRNNEMEVLPKGVAALARVSNEGCFVGPGMRDTLDVCAMVKVVPI